VTGRRGVRGAALVAVACLAASCGLRGDATSQVAFDGPAPAASEAVEAATVVEPAAATTSPADPGEQATQPRQPLAQEEATPAAPLPSPPAAVRTVPPAQTTTQADDRQTSLPPMCRPINWPSESVHPSDDVIRDLNDYGARHPQQWGEFWLWDDHVRVAFTGDLEGHRRRLEALLDGRHPLELVAVRWSYRELRAMQRRLVKAQWERQPVAGVQWQAVGTDVVNNTVSVMFDTVDRDVREAMAAQFGTERYCLEEGTVGPN